MRYIVALFLSITAFTLSGCGSSSKGVPVSGIVKFSDGTPLTVGRVVFEATGKRQGRGYTVPIQSDGTFKFKDDDILPEPGEYVVYITGAITPAEIKIDPVTQQHSAIAPEKKLVRDQFTSPATSGLTASITTGENKLTFAVEKFK